jgi:hypothetical protein
MVLSFTTGEYGKAAYGDAGSQTAGANGAIMQHNPLASAPQMKGGKRQRQNSKRQKRRSQKRQNSKRRNQNGGRKSRKQRGGK